MIALAIERFDWSYIGTPFSIYGGMATVESDAPPDALRQYSRG